MAIEELQDKTDSYWQELEGEEMFLWELQYKFDNTTNEENSDEPENL